MTRGQFNAFVEDYQRKLDQLQYLPAGGGEPAGDRVVRSSPPVEEGVRQAGTGVSGDLGTVSGTESLTPDQLRELYESRSNDVSPEYRAYSEAYFRAISQTPQREPTTQPGR